jgi:hypothetical protein
MNNFKDFANYGYTQKLNASSFRVYKNRNDWWVMCIPWNTGDITSIIWQGLKLHVRTDMGYTFIFSDFNDWEWIR